MSKPKSLRKWQTDFLTKWQLSKSPNWLVEACPGAGKTQAAISAMLFAKKTITRYFVIVPSASLRQQWFAKLQDEGFECIELPHDASNPWRKDGGSYDCAIITYQALSPDWIERIKMYCKDNRVMVIFDEVHHASEGEDSNVWGRAIYAAFGLDNPYVQRRLSLSGTPFRADGQRIAFINYDSSGYAMPDTRYSFQDGVQDKVVRTVLFPLQMGDVKWRDGERIIEANFDTQLDNRLAGQRYQTSIHHESRMVSHMISEAWKRLRDHRNNRRPDAGMIIFAKDQGHADKLSQVVVSVTGQVPVVVKSDDSGAGRKIEEFKVSSDPIIICVAMISEGTDIPRLTVAVYLSLRRYSTSWLWQCLGRVIRATDDPREIIASFYVPGDESFRNWITNVEQQVQEGLEERDRRERADAERVLKESTFVPMNAEFTHEDAYLYSQELSHISKLPPGYEEYLHAAQELVQRPGNTKTLREWIEILMQADGVDLKTSPKVVPHAQQTQQARDRVARLTQIYGGILSNLYGEKQFSLAAGLINKTDGKSLKDCTLSELLKREDTLSYWISQNGALHPKFENTRRKRRYNDYGY